MFRVLTIAREYGSGGASIARRVADRLGWDLLDKTLIEDIARAIHAEPELVGQYDEHVDSWLHRISRAGLSRGAFEGVAAIAPEDLLDAETVAEASRHVIEEAYRRGKCVIVGRGGQCVLQHRADALHVFVYAPWQERIARIRKRNPAAEDPSETIRLVDRQRSEHIRLYFDRDWSDRHLYHMLLSSGMGEDQAASLIVAALRRRDD